MSKTTSLTQARAKELLDYDPATGFLMWKAVHGRMKAGDRAGCESRGRRFIKIDYVRHHEHRVIWLWHYGTRPNAEIDHINRDGADNRLCNLREATRTANQANVSYHSRRKGATGVRHDKARGYFIARIRMPDGRRTYLGAFRSEGEAERAYAMAHRERLREAFDG